MESQTKREKIIHTAHVASRLNVPERTVRHLAAKGQIPGFKVGRKLWRFKESEIEALSGSLQAGGRP
jgi:excisionase family DNA binding protein